MKETRPPRPQRHAKLLAAAKITRGIIGTSADENATPGRQACASPANPVPIKVDLQVAHQAPDKGKVVKLRAPAVDHPNPKQEPDCQQPAPKRAKLNPPADVDANANAEDNSSTELPAPLPSEVQLNGSPVYCPGRRLGKGGFGFVFVGTRTSTRPSRQVKQQSESVEVALKFEHEGSKGCKGGEPYEWTVYEQLQHVDGLPRVYHTGKAGPYYVMVMDLLGPSLWDVWMQNKQCLSTSYVACIAMEAIAILQNLHRRGYVHGDIKPENFLLGPKGSNKEKCLFLVDLGLATRWKTDLGSHADYHQKPDDFRGTLRYASVHAHLGRTSSRRDDMESLAYSLIFLCKGRLPWQGLVGEDKGFQVCKRKMSASPTELCGQGLHAAFVDFLSAVANLTFDQEPPYSEYIAMFEPLVNKLAPPLKLEFTMQVQRQLTVTGRKRGRPTRGAALVGAGAGDAAVEEEDEAEEARPAKRKIRQGLVASQWILVFDKREPMKQRYHHGVCSKRLLQHIKKGWEDSLFISSVASPGGQWAVVMDAGTPYNQQIFKLHEAQFLPKQWILNKWDQGYYITGIAATADNTSLIVMSKGSTYTQQSYKVCNHFPYEWIKKKWKEGYHVTTMATADTQWAVVVSRNAGYDEQVVQLDFQYPSEGIHLLWAKGYRITCCAATVDQSALVLSIVHSNTEDLAQETLRTTQFPNSHVKDKWSRDMYISGMTFGRTTS